MHKIQVNKQVDTKLVKYPELSKEQQIERVYQHLIEKYGEKGYAKVYLEDKEFDESIKKLRQALSNKKEFLKRVKKVVDEKKVCP